MIHMTCRRAFVSVECGVSSEIIDGALAAHLKILKVNFDKVWFHEWYMLAIVHLRTTHLL